MAYAGWDFDLALETLRHLPDAPLSDHDVEQIYNMSRQLGYSDQFAQTLASHYVFRTDMLTSMICGLSSALVADL